MDAPAHDDAAHLCSLAGDEESWAKHAHDAFPECAKAANTANAANATAGGGSDDDDDDDDDDDPQAAPADKWTNGELFHWDPFLRLDLRLPPASCPHAPPRLHLTPDAAMQLQCTCGCN